MEIRRKDKVESEFFDFWDPPVEGGRWEVGIWKKVKVNFEFPIFEFRSSEGRRQKGH